MTALQITPLTRDHALDEFHSGAPELDDWLRRFALVAAAAGTARTQVLAEREQVLGYYALAPGLVARQELPP